MPRISQLPSLTAADNSDEIAIVDVSSSTTKKITRGDLLKAPLPANSVTTAAIQDGAVKAQNVDFATFGAPTTVAPSSGGGTWTKYNLGAFTLFIGERTATIGSWTGNATFSDVVMAVPTGESAANLKLVSTTYSSTSGGLSLYPSLNINWSGNNTPEGIRNVSGPATNFTLGARYVYIKFNG